MCGKKKFMVLETIDIPQADMLWDVVRVPEAVARGATTPEAIGTYIGRKGPRQGLYYTQAARVLGLVDIDEATGVLSLTPYGRVFVRYDRTSQRLGLRRLLRESEPTRSVLDALRARGALSLDEITQTLQQIAPLADSTAQRRARTISAWLVTAGLANRRGGQISYNPPLPSTRGFLRSS